MKNVDLDAHARRLRFPAVLEAEFRARYFVNSLLPTRIAIATALILWMAFGVLDYFVLPASHRQVWFWRFGVISPILVGVLALSFAPVFRRLMQAALFVMVLAGGFGLVAISAQGRPSEPGYTFYYAGLILVPLISYSFARLRFWGAMVANWIVVLVYVVSAVFSQDILRVPGGIAIFINSLFFIVAANIAGMGACYSLELGARQTFLANYRLELERAREQHKREQSESMLHILSQAIGVIVHDLGTPLTSVQLGADTLDLYLEQGQSDKETFHRITGFIKSGSQMLNFLRLSLMEQLRVLEGKSVSLDLRTTSLRHVIENGVRYQKPRFASQRTITIATKDIEVCLDEMRMITVFMNLIGNALKYSDGEVQILWFERQSNLIVAIVDKGLHEKGITKAQAAQLFVAFGRLENHREIEGTGFGLLSAQKIVEAHGGQLWIEGYEDGTADSQPFSQINSPQVPILTRSFLTAFVMSMPLRD